MTEPKKVIDQIIKASEADEVIAIIVRHDKTNLRWANSGLTTNGHEQYSYLAVMSVIDKRAGTAVATLNEATDPTKLARQSEMAARQSPQAEDYRPLVKGDGRWQQSPPAKLDSPEGLAGKLGTIFAEAAESDWLMFGYCELGRSDYWLANSAGVRRHYSHVQGQLEMNLKSRDYQRSVWAGQPLKAFSQATPDKLFSDLKQKMAWSENQLSIKPGKYEVILEPSAVSDMMLFAYWDSSARAAEEGRSAYSAGDGTVIDKQLYSDDISIYSDPAEPGLEVTPFDITFSSGQEESIFDNGLELKKTYWIKDGQQKHLIAPGYVADKYGYGQPTPFIPNLIFKSKGADLPTMIKATKRGLLVTTLWYMREVDPQTLLVTGLTRDGIFLIENGQVKGAVNNFRFNMSPLKVLKNTVEIGRSSPTLAREFGDYFPLTHMPILRVKDFNMSSVSKAK